MKTNLKGIITGVILGVILTVCSTAFAEEYFNLQKVDYPIYVNGKVLKQGGLPLLSYQNRTYIPLRKLAEATGASVYWNENTNSIHITNAASRTGLEPAPTSTPTPTPTSTPTPTATPTPTPTPTATPGSSLEPAPTTIKEIVKKSKSMLLVKVLDEKGQVVATGSGFVVSNDGKVVTNYHVVDKASSVQVVDTNNNSYNAEGIFGYDINRDVAVIKITYAEKLEPIQFGDSDKIEIGDDIVAIGSPLGIQNTLSSGLVSNLVNINNQKFIQMTAPISPGSSGGALFNMYGQVVGMTTAFLNDGQNMNLAIPSNEIKPFLSSTSIKTFSQLKKELYPEATYQTFAQGLINKYPTCTIDDTTISMSNMSFKSNNSDRSKLSIYMYLDSNNYSKLSSCLQKSSTTTKDSIAKWVSDLYTATSNEYPSKNIEVDMVYTGAYSSYPLGVAPDSVTFNMSTWQWEATYLFLQCTKSNGNLSFNWKI